MTNLEFDEFEMSAAYYEQFGVLTRPAWPQAIASHEYQCDHLRWYDTVQRMMFTAVHAGITSTKFRVGALNKATEPMLRLRSVYFKKFYFDIGLLPISSIKSFTALSANNVVKLNWEMIGGSNVKSVVVEKSTDARAFSSLESISVNYSEMVQKFTTEDPGASAAALYYRLKLTDISGKVSYSNVLLVKGRMTTNSSFKVYPNIVSSTATINMDSDIRQEASLRIMDISEGHRGAESMQLYAGAIICSLMTWKGLMVVSTLWYLTYRETGIRNNL